MSKLSVMRENVVAIQERSRLGARSARRLRPPATRTPSLPAQAPPRPRQCCDLSGTAGGESPQGDLALVARGLNRWAAAAASVRRSVHLQVVRFALPLLLISVPASAHDRSTSYSSWDIRGRSAQVTVHIAQLELSRFPWMSSAGADLDRMLGAYFAEQLQLFAGAAPCVVTDAPRALDAPDGRAVYEWRLACPDGAPLQIRSTLMLDVAPSHLHFARVARDGSPVVERVLSDGEQWWSLEPTGSATGGAALGTSLVDYVILGVRHIWTGYDHLAFLLALLLIGGSVAEVARIVTGFTVAHSITLAIAVLGYARPEAGSVEALIGLSIALVAAENIWLLNQRRRGLPLLIAGAFVMLALAGLDGYGRVPALTLAGLAVFAACYFELLGVVSRPALLRWAIAFVFGLVHGFGFAAVLSEAHLPVERLAHALFGFNVGVELGQLAIVSVVWPLLHLAGRPGHDPLRTAAVEIGSAAVCGLGLFWFVTRAYG